MKKILYCMHVGWNWIKQRPHFIAEELAKEYDVIVISDYNYRVKTHHKGDAQNLRIKNFYKIPKIDSTKHLCKVNVFLRKLYYLKYIESEKPDCIYVMTPEAINYIPTWYTGVVIYDCMDDMLSFDFTQRKYNQLFEAENNLINRSDIVCVSSENLKSKLKERYSKTYNNKYVLVRNGYSGETKPFFDTPIIQKEKKRHIICYFGTIASWMNFDYILKSLQDLDNIEYLLIGPKQAGVKVPSHSRIKYSGSIAHEDLYEATKDVDAFIMPFVLNDLILSVDPVKLYEYINFNRNIICVEYPEVERFSRFVYFYSDYESYVDSIKKAAFGTEIKYSIEDRKEFLESNTWSVRVKDIEEVLNRKINDCTNKTE